VAENPDYKDTEHGGYVPSPGDLRFVLRAPPGESQGPVKMLRILQRYEWSYAEAKSDWYDVPLIEEE
jgi:hypothetical protein